MPLGGAGAARRKRAGAGKTVPSLIVCIFICTGYVFSQSLEQ